MLISLPRRTHFNGVPPTRTYRTHLKKNGPNYTWSKPSFQHIQKPLKAIQKNPHLYFISDHFPTERSKPGNRSSQCAKTQYNQKNKKSLSRDLKLAAVHVNFRCSKIHGVLPCCRLYCGVARTFLWSVNRIQPPLSRTRGSEKTNPGRPQAHSWASEA